MTGRSECLPGIALTAHRTCRCDSLPQNCATAGIGRKWTLWSAARGEYMDRHPVRFAQYLLVGALRYPDSLFQVRLVLLFVASLFRTPHQA